MVKKDTKLVRLHELVQTLSKREYNKFIRSLEKENALKTKNLVCKVRKLSYHDLEHEFGSLNPSASTATLRMAFNRTIEKIDALFIGPSIPNFEDQSEHLSLVRYRLRSDLTLAEIYLRRGARTHAKHLIKQIVKESEKYKLDLITIEALSLAIDQSAVNNNMKELQAHINHQKAVEQHNTVVLLAEAHWRRLSTSLHKDSNRKSVVQMSKEAVQELQIQNTEAQSEVIQFYMLRIEQLGFELEGDWPKAFSCGKNILQLISKNPPIRLKRYFGVTYFNMSRSACLAHDFDLALETLQSAYPHLKARKSNLFKWYLMKIHAHFYLGQLQIALQYCRKLDEAGDAQGEFFQTFIDYMRCCCHLAAGEYHEIKDYLARLSPMSQDKEGYNLQMYIMRILVSIETKPLTDFEKDVHAFYVYLNATAKKQKVRERHLVIGRLLKALCNNSLDWRLTAQEFRVELQLLQASRSELSWEPLSAELIRFDLWLVAKASGKTYIDVTIEANNRLKELAHRA